MISTFFVRQWNGCIDKHSYSEANLRLKLNIQAATAGLTKSAAYMRAWKSSTCQGKCCANHEGKVTNKTNKRVIRAHAFHILEENR